ncbi:thiaminase II [Sinomicrobium sp.]
MNWSEKVWNSTERIYNDIINMSFIEELSNGTLDKSKFHFYIGQDALYLEHFGKALALIGSKLHNKADALAYMRFAESTIVVENALHESFFKEMGIPDQNILQPACHHYIHFLRSTVAFEPVEVAMAATLPCFWIYKKVGDYILSLPQTPNNDYQSWIDTYGGDDFATAVKTAIEICDRAAENTTPEIRTRMNEAYATASQLEFQFWQAAYDLKVWK